MIDRSSLHQIAKLALKDLNDYENEYRRYLRYNRFRDILNAREQRCFLGALLDCMSLSDEKCDDLFSSPYDYDNVPLMDSKYGVKYVKKLRNQIVKVIQDTTKPRRRIK